MKKILIVDIETTGFLNQGGSIVEIGIVELDLDSGDVKIIYDSLCQEDILNASHREYLDYISKGQTPPKDAKGWIFGNSNLTPGELRNAPAFDLVKRQVQEIINEYPLGITAFNKKFDLDLLRDRGITIPTELPCPMILSTDICKLPKTNGYGGYKWPKVEEAWEHFFGKDTGYVEAHRGADDAKHEAMIVYKLYEIGVFELPCKYVMLSQGFSFRGRKLSEVIRSGELREVSYQKAQSPPWGNGSYRVFANGDYEKVAENYDTSG